MALLPLKERALTQYTNQTNLPTPIAVWLAHDTYDREAAGLSATALLKPIRQVILSKRVPPGEGLVDISGLIKSRIGSAIHDAIEQAWLSEKLPETLASLGISSKVASRVVVNPESQDFTKPVIPMYLEQRTAKDVLGVRITGKFDFIADGRVHDFKTTSTFAYTSGNKDDDYILQGSIYRWLNPDIITDDLMSIIFIFTDWNKNRYLSARDTYPPSQIVSRDFKLLPLDTVQKYVEERVTKLIECENLPEDQLPLCTDKELWRKEDVFKYYKNPAATGKSTKNFDNYSDAYMKFVEDGSVGRIDTVKGQVTACLYCSGFTLCSQKDALIEAGELKL